MKVGDVFSGMDNCIETQIEWEAESARLGAERYWRLAREAIDRGEGSSLKPAERLLRYWFPAMVEAIKGEQEDCLSGRSGVGRSVYGPIIGCLDADRLAVIAIASVLSETLKQPHGSESRRVTHLIGSNVIAEIHHDLLRKNEAASLRDLDRRFKRKTTSRVNWWAKRTLSNHLWSRAACIHTGAALVVLLMRVALVNDWDDEDMVPAFEKTTVWRSNKPIVLIRMTDQAKELIQDGHEIRQYFRPRYLPMVCEPFKWGPGEDQAGGYVKHKVPLVTKPSPAMDKSVRNAPETFYECLNAIAGQAFSINAPVLGIVKRLWAEGGGGGLLPPADQEPLPPKPHNIGEDEAALSAWKAEASEVYARNVQVAGQRTAFLQNLTTAEQLVEHLRFWLPIMLCGRSRTYPIPNFNHHVGDLTRGLILAGSSRPHDTPAAQRWISIHLANTWGFDSGSYDARVDWAHDNMSLAAEVAKDPCGTTDVWAKADKPWQFLAACEATINPEIASRLLVQVDGSCNGLQHMAAMGLDEVGGALVNLVPGPHPADLYAEVARVTHETVERVAGDQSEESQLAREILASNILDPKLGFARKLCKRPAMTKSYRVSDIGVRDQVKDEMRKNGIERKQAARFSQFLGPVIQAAVGDRCPKANEIMDWFVECGKLMIDDDPCRAIGWTTSLGWRCEQPYRTRPRRHTIKTLLQEFNLGVTDAECPVARRKQLNGLTANVIHSEDGTHKLTTGLRCKDAGIAFADIFDCFQSHADDMPLLNHLLRSEFVNQHATDRLQCLHDEWKADTGLDLPPPPPRGSLDLNGIMQSDYFFN